MDSKTKVHELFLVFITVFEFLLALPKSIILSIYFLQITRFELLYNKRKVLGVERTFNFLYRLLH